MGFATRFSIWCLLADIAVVTIGAAAPASGAAAPVRLTTMVCTNPYNGAIWKISIDFANGTVDSNPARIDAERISWHDRSDGGNYTLERKSGKLTVIVASGTGAHFLYEHCKTD